MNADTKRSEAQEQADVVKYVRERYPGVLVTCCGAGLGFQARHQKRMNDLGYLKGTPDLLFFEPRGDYHGLFIEMKSIRGDLREHQKQMMHNLQLRGYQAHVCFGAEQAKAAIDKYFGV